MAPKRKTSSNQDSKKTFKKPRGQKTPAAPAPKKGRTLVVSQVNGPNVIETDDTPILAGYLPEDDLVLTNHAGEKLTLYSSQRRIGEILLRRSREMLNMSPTDPLVKINFLIIGPVQIEIRDQTVGDLGVVLENVLKDQNEDVVEVVESMVKRVKNSSSIHNTVNKKTKLSEEASKFLNALKKNPDGDHLHILFHDEAHWGIECESNLNQFLRSVLAILREHKRKGVKPHFLFVQVSATPQVLTFAASQNVTIVRWKAPPSYRNINDVRFINDCGQELMNQQKQNERGDLLVAQYDAVLTTWIECLRNPRDKAAEDAFKSARSSFPITYKALKQSVMDGITAKDAASRKHYSVSGGRNKCILVRLANVEQARALQNAVLAAFGDWTVFECLLYEGSTDATLSSRASGAPPGDEPETLPIKDLATKLDAIPAMVIVVDKMQMGSRIPHQTAIFDVRCRYVGSLKSQIKGNECTFVQDAGRMAGHKSREARILMSLIADADLRHLGTGEYKDGEDDSADEDEVKMHPFKFKFQGIHALMNKNGTPNKNFDDDLYDELSPFTIILEALPQIGKTGAIMAFLQKLYQQRQRK